MFEGTRAVGVEAESGGEVFIIEGDEIVLCAGGIASPQLLMLSGIGPAGQLRELGIPEVLDSPGVGQNLRDHPMAMLDLEPREGVSLAEEAPRIQTGLRYTAEGSHLRNDMQITLTSYAGERGDDPITGSGRGRNERTLHFSVILGLAESAGELTLVSTERTDGPSVDYRYLEDEFDVRRLREAIRLCAQLAEHERFRPLVNGLASLTKADLESDETLDAWLHENIATTFHTCGSCKMGPDSDPMAVVDQYCRVRGVQGLRVVDLSVAPNVVRANTNATAIMMAERVAEWFPSDRTQLQMPKAESLEATFVNLVKQWHLEPDLSSILAIKIENPAYGEIIEMGESVLPLIFREMETNGGHWTYALKAITGVDPLAEGILHNAQERRNAWLRWGRENGFLW